MSRTNPTPLHIRGCVNDEMWKAAQAWERETGQVAPYQHFAQAFRAGLDRAILEHIQENVDLEILRGGNSIAMGMI